MIKVASRWGVYLGSMLPEHKADLSAWRFAVATDDLRRIPKTLGMVAGGVEHPVIVQAVTWKTGPVYATADFPPLPRRFTAPPPPPGYGGESSDSSDSDADHGGGDDMICCSKRVLIDICRGMVFRDIPPEIREIITGVKSSGEVPIQVLRDLVLDPDSRRSGEGPSIVHTDEAGQGTRDSNLATLEVTQTRHNKPRHQDSVPSSPVDQSRESQSTRGRVATNQNDPLAAQTKDTAKGPSTELTQTGKDKNASILGKGCPAGEFLNNMAIHEAGKTKAKERQNSARPQQIHTGDKTAMASGAHGRPPVKPLCTSRHNRFAVHMGRGRGRGILGGPAQSRLKQGPRRRPIGEGGPNSSRPVRNTKSKGDKAQLFDVPIQLNRSPIAQPSAAQLTITQPKRKPTSDCTGRPEASGPKKRLLTNEASSSNPQATVQLDPTGFYEVLIPPSLAETIGAGCGLSDNEIYETLLKDNEERKNQMEIEAEEGDEELDLTPAEWEDLRRFDLDPADDLETDQEA